MIEDQVHIYTFLGTGLKLVFWEDGRCFEVLISPGGPLMLIHDLGVKDGG